MSTHGILQSAAEAMVAPSAHAPAGCVIGIDLDGKRHVVAAGLAAPEQLTVAPMHRGTLHDLASVSKAVGTTTALHRLASMGELGLDDTVVRFVPRFGGDRDTRIRDLLQHRAGVREWVPLYLAPDSDPLAVLDTLPLRYAPRFQRHYSDLGFMVLGRVVEAATGLLLDAAIRDLVARPLGLATLRYGPVEDDAATSSRGDEVERRMVATGRPYPVSWADDGFAWRTAPVRGEANDGNCFHAFGGVAGHAGLFGTVDDLLDVAAALSRADEEPELWNRAVTTDILAAGPDREQALGWRRRELLVNGERMPLVWHPGFTGCAVGFVPGRHIAVAFASNRLLAVQPQPTDFHWRRVLDALASVLSTGVNAP